MRGNDFDSIVDTAWRNFRASLADQLFMFTDRSFTWVAQNPEIPDGPHGHLDFEFTRANRLRMTLNPTTLHPDAECYLEQVEMLTELGWRQLRNEKFILERGRRHVDELAAIAVATLRQVWEVLHPAFLTSPLLESPAPWTEPPLNVGVIPGNADQLRALIVTALSEATGTAVELDDDGDVPLPTHPCRSWLQITPDAPRIELFAQLTDRIPDPAAAATYLAAQPTSFNAVRLSLRQGAVFAQMVLDARVFHDRVLTAAMVEWFDFMESDAAEIITTIEGAGADPTADACATGDCAPEEEVPAGLLAVLELAPMSGTVTPEDVAHVCDHDREAMLDYLHRCEEQAVEWGRNAAREIDADEAAACRHERRVWEVTAELLRDALRLVDDNHGMRPAG
ncbi:hypothetical protein GYA93_21190 [Gordonia desulfuricans]|uniref:YbjN domain-containing protein n=1 Tax=Gordonia desulfuricans TaxID=89051 RepID=A0A7K3LUU0_9ACTN|nr:hypothetical protein [Gordonia desulfuricans]NDK92065.1 hypothetical protein [Gordonia desulfuricans]